MAETLIVGFDGTEPSRRAIDFAASQAEASSAAVHVVHVLEWSPYSFLTQEELAERHGRRQQEMSRAEAVIMPAIDRLKARGIPVTHEIRYGHAAEIMCEIAEGIDDARIVVGRTGSSGFGRLFLGGLASALVQAAPVPVTVVP